LVSQIVEIALNRLWPGQQPDRVSNLVNTTRLKLLRTDTYDEKQLPPSKGFVAKNTVSEFRT